MNVRAHLSINLEGKITLERGIKAIGHKGKATFVFLGLGFHRRRVPLHIWS